MSESAAKVQPPPLVEGQVVTGTLFSEPMRVETIRESGAGTWIVGLCGLNTERFRKVTLTSADLQQLQIQKTHFTYDGDGQVLRIGVQAYSLGIAYEFDPYFGLSISRVDPLPHQLEAVYDYLLKLPSIRFLLADDAGAGKTIMAGLLIRELKLRGLAERVLIIYPANLTFQWQRELKEKLVTTPLGTSPRPFPAGDRYSVPANVLIFHEPDHGLAGGEPSDGREWADDERRSAQLHLGCGTQDAQR